MPDSEFDMKTNLDRSGILTSMITNLSNQEMAYLIGVMKSEMAKRGGNLPVMIRDSGVSVRVLTVCKKVGIEYWEQLAQYSEAEIKRFRNIGGRSFVEIIEELTKRGIVLQTKIMSYDENRISDQIDGGLHEREQLILSGVRLSLDFAEWIDINGIRDGIHEWKYKGDNYRKKHTTQEMFDIWQDGYTNEG